ncbi:MULTISPECIES: DUF2786 domain-containing protein [unclassified Streptomyces]|uniref:DUF2786 domain-containing protein n=1 Tax=unclassified Streptomyces TaxID=2593676 RepID=UPI002E2846A8|nr:MULTISPECIES: DUF2786 domain-containing protein [unclassified Streptomyces]WUB87542.1 DUF2786 domain-containing protein [Streptomyces sp. NBC_00566]
MTSTASTVERAFAAALYDDTDPGLDTGASLLAADPASDAELARRGEEFMATAWRRGWQPADVARLVRRDLEDAHLGLAAALIRAQAGRDRPRGPRWTAQLDALADQPDARSTDRFSYATTTLELYRLLLRLPTLEPLEEPRRPAGPGTSRTLGRIRALLAKAERTGYPEEAEALTAKAQELMARHSVDEALIAASAPAPDAPGACRIGVEPPYEQAKAVLLDAVARANHCRAVWNEPFGFSTVVGFEADLEAVELLHTSLLVQATHAMAKAEAAQRAGGRKRTKTFRQSFLAAYAHRVGDRLAAAAESQVSQDLLPVLVTRETAVTDRVDSMFPQTTTTRLRGVSDEAGWTEGARAADEAQVRSRRRLP